MKKRTGKTRNGRRRRIETRIKRGRNGRIPLEGLHRVMDLAVPFMMTSS